MEETRKNKRLYSALYGTEYGRFFLAAVVSLAVLGVVFLIVHPVFMTIDDARLRYVYAGYATGTPESNYLFSYGPWSTIISALYRLKSGFPWYALAQFSVIGFSSVLIGKTIYKVSFRKKLPIWLGVILHVFVYYAFCLIATILMHFEITAILIGTAGATLVLGISPEEDSKRQIVVDCIVAVLVIALSFAIQFNAFYATCCYLLVALIYHFFRAVQKKYKLKMAILWVGLLLGIGVSVFACKAVENHKKSSEAWAEYMEYNKYRVSYWDYPHIGYAEDPELFESMGWTEDFYNLTNEMYFMDARFNKENLEKFTKRFSWLNFGTSDELVERFSDSFSSLFRNSKIVMVQSALLLGMFAVAVGVLFRKNLMKRLWPGVLAAICCFMGTLLLVSVLAMKGRLPLRAWLACIIPGGVILSYLFIDGLLPEIYQKLTSISSSVTRKMIYVLAAVVAVGASVALYHTYRNSIEGDYHYRAACNHSALDMEAYAMSHPENIYVFDHFGAQNYNVFREYDRSSGVPTNAVVWGSSYVFTPTYYKQLAGLGRDKLLTEDLFADNVYFIGAQDREYSYELQLMLQEQYGNITFNAVDYIGQTFTVYKIEMPED